MAPEPVSLSKKDYLKRKNGKILGYAVGATIGRP